jgi:hypothetical protein
MIYKENDEEPTAAPEQEIAQGDTTPATVPPVLDLRRTSLAETMPDDRYAQLVAVTRDFLDRRFATTQRLVDVASTDVNLNPFLMLAMAPAYNIFSPYEAAEYAQNAKLPHGDATAFGRFVEEQIFPIFGSQPPAEKPLGRAATRAHPEAARLFSSIDAEIYVEGRRYLMTYKSGPWTMNQSHANEMIANFPGIHAQTECDIIIGITYGKRDRVNNKPELVMSQTGSYVHTLVGRDLWEFITGVAKAHLAVYNAIRAAQRQFAIDHGGKTYFEHLIEARLRLAESFRDAFDLVGADDDMWNLIFKGSF